MEVIILVSTIMGEPVIQPQKLFTGRASNVTGNPSTQQAMPVETDKLMKGYQAIRNLAVSKKLSKSNIWNTSFIENLGALMQIFMSQKS